MFFVMTSPDGLDQPRRRPRRLVGLSSRRQPPRRRNCRRRHRSNRPRSLLRPRRRQRRSQSSSRASLRLRPSRRPLRRTATPPNAPPAPASPEEKAKAFIASFDGGECFLIEPLPGATRPHEYQAVGREIEPFRRFDSAYKREVGVEADLTVAPISAAQCPALDLVRLAAPGGQEPPRLTLKSYEVGRGKPLQGTISNLEGRHPYLLLVDNDGVVHRLEATVDASGDSANFDVPLTPDASSVGPMQMLLAIVSDKPIPALDALHSANPN